MRISIRSLLLGAGALALLAACRGRDSTAATDPDLQRDLAAAGSDPIDLAATNQASTATVSALEAPPLSAPEPRPRPRRNPGPRVVPDPAPTVEAQEVVTEVAEAPEPEPEPSPVVDEAPVQQGVALPRPVPQVPSSGGAGNDGTWGRGPSAGDVIGVVIRGGYPGEDHCDPRVDGRRGGRRYPPIYRPIPDGQTATRGGILRPRPDVDDGAGILRPRPGGSDRGGVLRPAGGGGGASGGSAPRGASRGGILRPRQ